MIIKADTIIASAPKVEIKIIVFDTDVPPFVAMAVEVVVAVIKHGSLKTLESGLVVYEVPGVPFASAAAI
jgi:hypothetical protein